VFREEPHREGGRWGERQATRSLPVGVVVKAAVLGFGSSRLVAASIAGGYRRGAWGCRQPIGGGSVGGGGEAVREHCWLVGGWIPGGWWAAARARRRSRERWRDGDGGSRRPGVWRGQRKKMRREAGACATNRLAVMRVPRLA